jgi:hypothetical protein
MPPPVNIGKFHLTTIRHIEINRKCGNGNIYVEAYCRQITSPILLENI